MCADDDDYQHDVCCMGHMCVACWCKQSLSGLWQREIAYQEELYQRCWGQVDQLEHRCLIQLVRLQ